MRVMAALRKYPDELRERATRLAVDARRDPATRTGALKRIGEQLGINAETLRKLGDPGRGRRGASARHHDR
jgi:transposase-like protein